MPLIIEWAKDNDADLYIENLPTGLSLEVFIAATNAQTATAIHDDVKVTPTWGTWDIPARYDIDGVEIAPARPGVTCYKAPFEGDKLTAHCPDETKRYLIVRYGQDLRVYAELYVREHRAGVPRVSA